MKTLERKPIPYKFELPERIIDKSLPDLSNHPVVLRKAAKARKLLEENPIPEHLLPEHIRKNFPENMLKK